MITYRQPFRGEWPITQRYGEIVPGVTKNNQPHTGIDYGCPENTLILASADGEVMFAGWDPTGYGYAVILQHPDGRATLYAHLQGSTVRINQHVRQGDVIGVSGDTGYATGPHLHFEARSQWNNYRTHFDPLTLPLMSMDDAITEPVPAEPEPVKLKEPEELGQAVVVTAPDGARVFNPDWSMRYTGFPQGTQLYFTGRTEKRPGFPEYTYCEVYEEPRKYYVAVHDGRTQILDNPEE